MSIIDIIEDKEALFVAQPVMHELEYVGLGIVPTRNIDLICNIPIPLLEARCVARVDPENPSIWRSLFDLVGVFDGKLRLSFQKSAVGSSLMLCLLTQHRLTQRALF
jgi:hypothetical protein